MPSFGYQMVKSKPVEEFVELDSIRREQRL